MRRVEEGYMKEHIGMIPGTNQQGMTREELDRMLASFKSWGEVDETTKVAFAKAASKVRYGVDALITAWCWFLLGVVSQRERNVS